MVDIGQHLNTHVPNAEIDGKVGRNLYAAIPLVERQYNKKYDHVVIELGTSGDFSKEQLDELIGKFGSAKVYLINTRVPRNYESHVNTLMNDAAKSRIMSRSLIGTNVLKVTLNTLHQMIFI
ncbi:hypothetical protein ACA31_07510 [Staphylococcus sp. NAM3COL9]|nr:hypothetical protein ACA31_07510 [Staphylococcus sp. NAM3COL9]